ncbi:MAG TPA: UPF0236 family protein [Atribacterota bacterium]|nr:UPF0236 family protein [Atribacterota bacterium]
MDTNTITITIPQVKVEIPIKGLTFDILENMIFDMILKIAQIAFSKALLDIDSYLRKNRRRGQLKNTGKRSKTFLTRFGDVSFSRTRYLEKTGKARYLLDETLSTIKNQRISLTRAMMECLLATLSSYREVVNQTRLLLGYSRSHESIRRNILSEAKLMIGQEKKRLQQIENLDLPARKAPEVVYTEADATYIKLQKPEKDQKLEVKIGIGYTGKENRYHTGNSQRLKEKFVYIGTGKDFMDNFSLRAEEELNLSQAKRHYFGADGDKWITAGIRDYFPNATYLLCRFHLNKRLRESLPGNKVEQKLIRNLPLANQIEEALAQVDRLLVVSSDPKQKKLLADFYRYVANNRQGITNQVTLKDKDIAKTGAIESNVNTVICSRLKQGRSWSKRGGLSILKVKETFLNRKWDSWWKQERNHPLKVIPLNPPLSAACFTQEVYTSAVIQVRIPALEGPNQDRPWVGVLRKLSQLEIV